MYAAHRDGNTVVIAVVVRWVVRADLVFTTTVVLAQPVTGYLLVREVGYSLAEGWIVAAPALYVVTGACWLPVVWLQTRMRDMAIAAARDCAELPARYYHYARIWFWLGWPAFAAIAAMFVLILVCPGAWNWLRFWVRFGLCRGGESAIFCIEITALIRI